MGRERVSGTDFKSVPSKPGRSPKDVVLLNGYGKFVCPCGYASAKSGRYFAASLNRMMPSETIPRVTTNSISAGK